jgi:hypothetical protein
VGDATVTVGLAVLVPFLVVGPLVRLAIGAGYEEASVLVLVALVAVALRLWRTRERTGLAAFTTALRKG